METLKKKNTPYVITSGNTPILIFTAVILARMGINV
jgi:hypothetical protein